MPILLAVVAVLAPDLARNAASQVAPARDAAAEGPAPQAALPQDAAPQASPEGAWADSTLQSLTLREKVGQMLVPQVLGDFEPEGTESHQEIVDLIENVGIGGLIVSVGSPTNVAVKLNDLQEHSRIPLLVSSDLETGAGFRFAETVHLPGVVEMGGATDFPPMMALGAIGDPRYAYEVGRVTALEARALGIHVPFAPVLDVNNNPENPVINVRAFGENPDLVAEMGAAFVRGVEENGALATGKHFPGHGDTSVDSHSALPVIAVDRARLDAIELRPFRAAIAAGMGGVMTAHLSIPELTGSSSLPATLSRPVLTDLLRGDLGFQGLIFTDAMNMGAVTRSYPNGEASIRAIEAGADVILMPSDPADVLRSIVRAVASGRIAEARIDESVLAILRVKERMGLHRDRFVSPDALTRTVGIQEHIELSQEIARRSITVLRSRRNLLPLLGTRSADVYSVAYRGRNDLLAGKYFDDELRRTYPRLRNDRIHRGTEDEEYDDIARRAAGMDLVVVSLYVSSVSRNGDPVLSDELRDFIERLEERGTPHIVISFGNPYLITEIPDIQAYMLAWGGGRWSQEAASRALFGDVPVEGRLPIVIPDHYAMGAGMLLGGAVERAGER